MQGYSAYWRTTVFAAIALHFMTWMGFAYVLPHLLPEPEIEAVQEIEWMDVELPEEVSIVEEAVPEPPAPEPEPIVEEIPFVEEPEESEEEETPTEAEEPDEAVEKLKEELEKADPKDEKPDIVIARPTGNQQMGQPPVVLTEVYPPAGGIPFKGRVAVAATIGKDGKVKKTKMMVKSGRLVIDNIAMSAASKWTFKPALDQEGKPMECDKIITIDFRKL